MYGETINKRWLNLDKCEMHLLLFLPLVGLVFGECPHRVKRQDGYFRSYYNQFPSGFATLSIGGKKTPEPKYVPITAPIYPTYEPVAEYPVHGCPKLYGQPTKCRPVGECAVWFQDIIIHDGTTCELEKGGAGLCCPGIPKNGRPSLFKRQNKKVQLRTPIDIYDLNAAAEEGQVQIKLLGETEKLLLKKGIQVQRNTPAFGHLLFFQTSTAAIGFSRSALLAVESTEALSRRFGMTPEEAGFGLAGFSLRDTVISDACFADEPCDESAFFRSHDGSCNNLRIGNLGKSKTPFQRILPAQYADGVWLPREAKSGRPLPSARLVSISVVPDVDSPHYGHSLWTMQWGQFVDHDLTSTPVFRIETNGTGIICCGSDGKDLPSPVLVHPECFSIEIPEDDPFFARHGQRCMSFVRSMPAPRLDCSFGHGEQMNQLTHYLDGSNVYGSTKEEADELRTFREGTLKVAPRNGFPPVVGGDLLPPDSDPEMSCSPANATREIPCFKAGDSRSNEQPDLAVTHTIFLREHNRVATDLGHLNPHWDDERIYQETRRIVIAELQHITYNEWLEPILGRQAMEAYGLLPLQYGFSRDYSEDINPTIMNEFASAAFRFGHTLVQGHVELINQNQKVESTLLLRQHFFKSEVVYTPGNLDKFLIGLANQPQQDFDNYVSAELTNHLFQESDMEFGMDLVSLNIQRSRDHGIPGYNSYREICGLPRARYFEDLLDVIPHPIIERFKLLYHDVDDIDLFIAGISERPSEGALLGPTFQCIIGDQFSRLKMGDRYFYELGGMEHSFTEAQLNEIRKITLARVICDNSDVETTQPLLFWTPSHFNEPVSCKGYTIPRIDLYPWKEDTRSSNYKPKIPQYPKRPSHKPSKPKITYEQSQYKAEYYGPYNPKHYETYRTRPEHYRPEIYSFEQRIPNNYNEREYRGNRRY